MNDASFDSRAHWRTCMLAAAFLLAMDQGVKWLLTATLPLGEHVMVTSWFNLVHVLNPGAAFSFLANAGGWQRHALSGIGMVVSLVLSVLLWHGVRSRLETVAYVGLIGGACPVLGTSASRGARSARPARRGVIQWHRQYWRGVRPDVRLGTNACNLINDAHMDMPIAFLKRQAPICFAFLMGAGVWSSAWAQVTVDRAWARATVPNQTSTGAFMRVTAQKDVRLTGARSPVADIVEVHEMKMDNDVMRMRPVGNLQLKAGQSIELKSGGYHLMMMGLKQQLRTGQTVPLTLEFKAADGSVSKVDVKAIASFTPAAP